MFYCCTLFSPPDKSQKQCQSWCCVLLKKHKSMTLSTDDTRCSQTVYELNSIFNEVISESQQGHWPEVRSNRCQRSGLDVGWSVRSGVIVSWQQSPREQEAAALFKGRETTHQSSETWWHLVRQCVYRSAQVCRRLMKHQIFSSTSLTQNYRRPFSDLDWLIDIC